MIEYCNISTIDYTYYFDNNIIEHIYSFTPDDIDNYFEQEIMYANNVLISDPVSIPTPDMFGKRIHALQILGVHGAVNKVCSNNAWKKMSLQDKFNNASSVDISVDGMTIYKDVSGTFSLSNPNIFDIKSHNGSVSMDFPCDVDSVIETFDEALSSCIIIVPFVDLVYMRQNKFLFDFDNLRFGKHVILCSSLQLPDVVVNSGLTGFYNALDRVVYSRLDQDAAFDTAKLGLERLIKDIRSDHIGRPFGSPRYLEVQALFGNASTSNEGATTSNGGFFSNISGMCAKANHVLDNVEQTDIVNRASQLLGNMEDHYTELIQFVSKFMTSHFDSMVDNAICDAILFVDWVRALLKESWYDVVSCMVRLGSRLGINQIIIHNFICWLQSETSSPQVREDGNVRLLESQGGHEVGSIFIAFVGLLFLKSMPNPKTIKEVTEFAKSYNICLPTIKSLSNVYDLLPTFLPACVQSWLQYLCPAEAWFNFVNGGFRDWADRCDALLTPENENRCKYDRDIQDLILGVAQEGKKYIDLASTTPEIPPRLFSCIQKLCDKIDEFVKLIEVARGTRGHRMAPFVISIYGASDIGKSGMISHFANLLRPCDYPKNNLVYCRQAGTDYWDGYTGQFCTSIDDYNQFVESDDYKEMVSMCTSEVYHLPMASLNDKTIGVKGTVFSSDLVVTTTNVPFPVINDVRTQTAVWRRRNILWHMRVKQEYLNVDGKPDWENIPISVLQSFGHLQWRWHSSTDSGAEAYLTPWMETVEAFKLTYQEWEKNRARESFLYRQRLKTDFVDDLRVQWVEAQGLRDIFDKAKEKSRNIYYSAICSIPWTEIQEEIITLQNKWRETNPYVMKIVGAFGAIGVFVGIFSLCKWLGKKESEITAGAFNNFMACEEEEGKQTGSWFVRKLCGGLDCPSYEEQQERGIKSLRMQKVEANSVGPGMRVGRTQRVSRKPLMRYAEGMIEKIQPQTSFVAKPSADKNGVELVDLLANSMLYATVEFEGKASHMCGFAVGFDFVLFPYHLFLDENGDLVTNKAKISVESQQGAVFEGLVEPECIHQIQTKTRMKDVVLYKFGSRMRNFRNRTPMFISKSDISNVRNSPGILISSKNNKIQTHYIPKIIDLTVGSVYEIGKREFMMTVGWEYSAATTRGDCGSVLMCCNSTLKNKLCGIHVAGAGYKSMGISEIVYQEDLIPILDKYRIKVEGLPKPTANLLHEEPRFCMPEGNYSLLGKLPSNEVLRLPTKSSIKPSVIYEQVAIHVTEPAVLSPFDERLVEPCSPLANGVAKYGKPSKPFDWSILEFIIDDMIRQLNWPNVEPLFVLSDSQAINGIDGKDYFDALNMQSSPGWPFKLRYPGKTKEVLFRGEHPNMQMDDPDLISRYKFREECGKQGIRVPSAWVDCLKDERRKLEKIKSGKTRVFAIAPLDFVILSRKYFLAFAARFYEFRKYGWSAVGIDCESPEWHDTVSYLLENSEYGFAGDFGRFDGTLSADCMAASLHVIEQCYQGSLEEQRCRAVLFDEIIHTVHLAMDAVYVCHGGNPSGNPLTVVLNSMVNYMYLAYTWIQLAPIHLASMKGFTDNVRLKIYGDDNWISVKSECLSWYNLVTVSKYLETLGIEYTGPTKDAGDMVPYMRVVEWSFLKRKSCKINEISSMFWLAQIDTGVIFELTNWIRESEDDYFATVENLQTALRYAFFHGRKFFEDFRKKIISGLVRKNELVPALFTWSELRNVYLEKGGFQIYEAQGDTENLLGVTGVDGIKLTEATDVVTEQQTPQQNNIRTRARGTIGETEWNLLKMVERYNYVTAFNWVTGEGVNTVKYSQPVPHGMLSLDVDQVPFYNFIFWRGNVHIRIQLNGTRFHCGRLIAYFVPLSTGAMLADWHYVNRAAQTTVNHVFLDPSISNSVELCIPFASWRNFVYTDIVSSPSYNLREAVESLGMFTVSVFNPLQASTGASNELPVTIWMALKDSEFHVPRPTFEPPIVFEKKMLKYNITRNKQKEDAKKERLNDAMRNVQAQGNTVSSKVTNVFHKAQDVTLPIETVGDKIDAQLSIPGMDKVNVGMQPIYLTRKPLGYTSHSENLEFLQRFSLKPSALNIVDKEHFATATDEMSLAYITRLPTFWFTTNWSENSPAGTSLATDFICPISDTYPGLSLATGPQVVPLLHYVSIPFSFWRGGIIIHFDIVATAFMTGRLLFSAYYGYAPPGTIEGRAVAYNVEFDLNASNHHFTVELPYVSPYPWLRVPCGYGYLSTFTQTPTDPTFAAHVSALGTWQLSVLNPLRVPEGSPTNIEINAWISGADDFELSCLASNNASIRALTAQGSVTQGSEDANIPPTHLMRRQNAIKVIDVTPQHDDIQFGEKYKSIREVMKRYIPVTLSQWGDDEIRFLIPETGGPANGMYFATIGWFSANAVISQVPYTFYAGASTTPTYWNSGFHSWFANMYRVWRGSMRYKVLNTHVEANVNTESLRYTRPQYNYMLAFDPLMLDDMSTGGTATVVGDIPATSLSLAFPGDFQGSTRLLPVAGMPFSSKYYFGANGMPTDFSYDGAAYNEIEVPFQTMFNVLSTDATRTGNSADFITEHNWLATPGNVYVYLHANQKLFGDLASLGKPMIVGSVGDDFRLGLLLGPHKIQVAGFVDTGTANTIPFFPDTWPPTV